MRTFIRLVGRVSTWCGMLAVVLIGLSILVVSQMVFLRYGLGASTAWQTDFVTFALVGATLIGSPYVLLLNGHVTVELIEQLMLPYRRRWFRVMGNAGTLLFSVVLAIMGGVLTWEAWSGGWETDTIAEIPLWIPYLALPVGFGLLALQALANVMAAFVLPPGTPPEAAPQPRRTAPDGGTA